MVDERTLHAPTPTIDSAAFLERHGRKVVDSLIDGPASGSAIRARTLRTSAHHATLDIEFSDLRVVVKHFDVSSPAGLQGYRRERTSLESMAPSGLAPRLMHRDDVGCFVVMEHVDGQTFAEGMAPDMPDMAFERLGHWLGTFATAAPSQPADGTWADYLNHYGAMQGSAILNNARGFLATLPLTARMLSKNDGALSNLIVRPDRTLVGIDFEHAALKPLGWDFLLTARALTKSMPRRCDEVLSALARGFSQAAPGPDRGWATLAKVFALASLGLPGPVPGTSARPELS